MKVRITLRTIALLLLTLCLAPVSRAEDLPRRTALDDYIEKPDDSYSWKIASTKNADGVKTVVVDMVSQTWRTKEDVDRPEWRHWLTVSMCIWLKTANRPSKNCVKWKRRHSWR